MTYEILLRHQKSGPSVHRNVLEEGFARSYHLPLFIGRHAAVVAHVCGFDSFPKIVTGDLTPDSHFEAFVKLGVCLFVVIKASQRRLDLKLLANFS